MVGAERRLHGRRLQWEAPRSRPRWPGCGGRRGRSGARAATGSVFSRRSILALRAALDLGLPAPAEVGGDQRRAGMQPDVVAVQRHASRRGCSWPGSARARRAGRRGRRARARRCAGSSRGARCGRPATRPGPRCRWRGARRCAARSPGTGPAGSRAEPSTRVGGASGRRRRQRLRHQAEQAGAQIGDAGEQAQRSRFSLTPPAAESSRLPAVRPLRNAAL